MRALVATRGQWHQAAVSVALGAGAVIAAGALLSISGYLISRAAQQPPILTLTVAIVGVRFFGLLRALLRYGERLTSHDLAFRASTELRGRFFERLVPLVPGGLGSGSGDLLSRFVADTDRMQDLYLRAVCPPLIAAVAGAAGLIATYLILPETTWALLGILLAGGIAAPLAVRAIAKRAGANQAPARAALSQEMVEIVTGAPELAAAGREQDWADRAAKAGSAMTAVLRRNATAGGVGAGTAAAIGAGAATVMAIVAIPEVDEGALPGVLLAALVLLAFASVEAIAPLGLAAASIDAVACAAARLEEITDRPPPVLESSAPQALPTAGDLQMRGVSFVFPGGHPLLRDVDLTLRRGESVAVLGPSGAGKSTIADLLVRFIAPSDGMVALGDVDLARLDPDELRQAVRLAPQESHMFAGTIRANLQLAAPGSSENEMATALHRVGLGPWLASLPSGLDSEIGDRGTAVSGGQRQRISVARNFLSRARFLLFDEPTTHLDLEGGRRLISEICNEARIGGRGALVITHDETDLVRFDRVLVLNAGRLLIRDS